MRTTLVIDDDVLSVAKEIAVMEKKRCDACDFRTCASSP